MKDFFEIALSRASTKGFLEKMPDEADINRIIEAGLKAASGRNMQAPIIISVTNKRVRDLLSLANASVLGTDSDPFYSAPAVLAVVARKDAHTYLYDGSLVLGNMMLAAHALGLGACWIHRAKEVFEKKEWKSWLSELGIEGEVEGIGNLIIGYPKDKIPEPKPTKPNRVFYVK